jgi:hypothetical protein
MPLSVEALAYAGGQAGMSTLCIYCQKWFCVRLSVLHYVPHGFAQYEGKNNLYD